MSARTLTIRFRPPLRWTIAFVVALGLALWFLDPWAVAVGWFIGHAYCAAGLVNPLLADPGPPIGASE